jgi:hypothetical protein
MSKQPSGKPNAVSAGAAAPSCNSATARKSDAELVHAFERVLASKERELSTLKERIGAQRTRMAHLHAKKQQEIHSYVARLASTNRRCDEIKSEWERVMRENRELRAACTRLQEREATQHAMLSESRDLIGQLQRRALGGPPPPSLPQPLLPPRSASPSTPCDMMDQPPPRLQTTPHPERNLSKVAVARHARPQDGREFAHNEPSFTFGRELEAPRHTFQRSHGIFGRRMVRGRTQQQASSAAPEATGPSPLCDQSEDGSSESESESESAQRSAASTTPLPTPRRLLDTVDTEVDRASGDGSSPSSDTPTSSARPSSVEGTTPPRESPDLPDVPREPPPSVSSGSLSGGDDSCATSHSSSPMSQTTPASFAPRASPIPSPVRSTAQSELGTPQLSLRRVLVDEIDEQGQRLGSCSLACSSVVEGSATRADAVVEGSATRADDSPPVESPPEPDVIRGTLTSRLPPWAPVSTYKEPRLSGRIARRQVFGGSENKPVQLRKMPIHPLTKAKPKTASNAGPEAEEAWSEC